MAETRPTDAAPNEEDAPVEQPEARVSLTQWAARNAFREVNGERVPAQELMGGFVARMRQEKRLVATPSDFARRWKKFQRE